MKAKKIAERSTRVRQSPPAAPAQLSDGARRAPAPGRSRRLRAAILQRFGTLDAFHAWAREQARVDAYAPLTDRTLTQIDRGITPSLPRIQALAAAADLPFEDVARELGVDFRELPRLRAALGSGFTRVEPASLVYPTRAFSVPAAWSAAADPSLPDSLPPLVARWETETAASLTALMHPQRISVLLDEPHGLGHPRVPLRSLLHVDTSDVTPAGPDHFYLVEHPYGWGCCRVTPHRAITSASASDEDTITLHSEDPGSHPSLQFPSGRVRIHGRVVACAARIDRLRWPAPTPLDELARGPGAWHGPAFWQSASSTAMLQYVWAQRGFSYQSLKQDVARLHEISAQFREPGGASARTGRVGAEPRPGRRRRGTALSVGSLQNHLDPDKRVMPVLETVFALAAVFGVEVRDLVRAYGVAPTTDRRLTIPDAAPGWPAASGTPWTPSGTPTGSGAAEESSAARLHRLRTDPFGAHLEREGWDLPWLLSLLRWGSADKVFHLGASNVEMAPLLLSNAFVVVDPLQRPAPQGSAEALSEATDWRRPLYLLRVPSRKHLVCAHCETAPDGSFWLIPHPRAAPKGVEYVARDQASVLGRVTHMATLLP